MAAIAGGAAAGAAVVVVIIVIVICVLKRRGIVMLKQVSLSLKKSSSLLFSNLCRCISFKDFFWGNNCSFS